MSKIIEFQYRDGANYKRNFSVKISEKKFKKLTKQYGVLKEGVEVFYDTDLGISRNEFMENLGYDFDPEFDHNILEIQQILSEGDGEQTPISFYIDCDENS